MPPPAPGTVAPAPTAGDEPVVLSVAGAEDVDLDAPAGTFDGTVAADLAVAVAPSVGRFRPADLTAGFLPAGALLGHITGGGGRADEVRTPVTALLRDLLVRPGQLVARGQPLAWLQRAVGEPLDLGWEAGA